MSKSYENEPMLEVYTFETDQQVEKIEQIVIESERANAFDEEGINEIFRCMHTIKGSSAMMLFDGIATVAHKMEDIFFYIREHKPEDIDFHQLSDIVLEGVDFIKLELVKIKNRDEVDGEYEGLLEKLIVLLKQIKGDAVDQPPSEQKKIQYYIPQDKKASTEECVFLYAKVKFQEGAEMENIRAYTLVFSLEEFVVDMIYFPGDIAENEQSAQSIKEDGFEIYMCSKEPLEVMKAEIEKTIFLESVSLKAIDEEQFKAKFKPMDLSLEDEVKPDAIKMPEVKKASAIQQKKEASKDSSSATQHMISVHIEKLDKLMNMVGELVIAEAMVTQNPDILSVESDSFHKASRMLHKITGELQDTVMSIRMVPLSTTFVKMHRIVRDMCKKLNKSVALHLSGEETEVDKNIIEHISDPFIHIIRNAIDHGIETEEDRLAKDKPKEGNIYLEAKNVGSDVHIVIKDDGKGLDKNRIIEKAIQNGLIETAENMTDREIFSLILLPGFSTKEEVSEFSGRGVGMDVVVKKLESVGGVVFVESEPDVGTSITMKIPLTLAIIEGMNIKVGQSRYTVPLTAIKESFRPKPHDCIMDPDHNEMIMIRGECFPVLRLHQMYKVPHAVEALNEGILVMVEQDEKTLCLFADELLGQQQVVVKTLPDYIRETKNITGITGCTLLGDGSISLILDIAGLTGLRIR